MFIMFVFCKSVFMMLEQLKYNLSFSIKSKQSYFLKKSKIILLQTARTKLDLNISPAAVIFMKVWPCM